MAIKKHNRAKVVHRLSSMSVRQARPTSTNKGLKPRQATARAPSPGCPETRQTSRPRAISNRKPLRAEGRRAAVSPGPNNLKDAAMAQKARMGFSR